jgi:hypothetical protein
MNPVNLIGVPFKIDFFTSHSLIVGATDDFANLELA